VVYPVGLPTVWSYHPNHRRPTLGEWLESTKGQLVPGLWQAVVSGQLPFEQDLIYSKLVKRKDIQKAARTGDDDGKDFASDFVILRKEVKNGVITSDALNALLATCSTAERAAVLGLEVVTAVAYLAKDRRDSAEVWVTEVMADRGTSPDPLKPWKHPDTRTRAWWAVPLEGFMGKLLDARKAQKARGKEPNLSETERTAAKALDGMLKLFINTLYGDLASRFFSIGNTVVGNNITAKARVGVWMLAKALRLRQCITDGGIYQHAAVPAFVGKKPGLDTLSRMWQWSDSRRGRILVPMGGRDWTGPLPPCSELDRLAAEHVRQFWAPYGLELPFKVEHKAENTFTKAAYLSKGDYGLRTPKGDKIALRGKDRPSKRSTHPTFKVLGNLLNGEDAFPADLSYKRGGILRVGKWKVIQQSGGPEYAKQKHLRPGDGLPEREYQARYNNHHFPLAFEQDYVSRRNRRQSRGGRRVQWFEKHAHQGIRGVIRQMAKNNLN
jgi:hypothetical protein